MVTTRAQLARTADARKRTRRARAERAAVQAGGAVDTKTLVGAVDAYCSQMSARGRTAIGAFGLFVGMASSSAACNLIARLHHPIASAAGDAAGDVFVLTLSVCVAVALARVIDVVSRVM